MNVESSLIVTGCVFLERITQENCISNIFRIFTTTEQKLCTANNELIGNVKALTLYEYFNIGSDHLFNVLKSHEKNFNCFTKKENFSIISNCTKANNRIANTPCYLYERKSSFTCWQDKLFFSKRTATKSIKTWRKFFRKLILQHWLMLFKSNLYFI